MLRSIEHPAKSGFPFIELSGIKPFNRMKGPTVEEVVACAPVDVREGEGSYFNTVHQQDGKIFIRTMMGRSDKANDAWVYAGEQITELKRNDPNYEKAMTLLNAA